MAPLRKAHFKVTHWPSLSPYTKTWVHLIPSNSNPIISITGRKSAQVNQSNTQWEEINQGLIDFDTSLFMRALRSLRGHERSIEGRWGQITLDFWTDMGQCLRSTTRKGEQKCRKWPCVRSVNGGSIGFKIKEQTATVQFAHLPQHHSHNTPDRHHYLFHTSSLILSLSTCIVTFIIIIIHLFYH